MNTITDYIAWRGDLTFASSPMNDVDNYIIAKLGTPDFTHIVPESFTEKSLASVLRTYELLYGEDGDDLGALASEKILPVMRLLPETPRFRELTLSGFRKVIDPGKTKQFSAITIGLPDGRHYVSFRGTDDTLLGWKENLLMSAEPQVEAQRDAAEYLLEAAGHIPGRLVVGGHSKGGNLAVYAAAMAPPEIQDRIATVYSNDGPGFLPDFLETDGYLRIRPKIRLLIPEHSVVGTLLSQSADTVYIRSKRSGIASHDGFVWQVMGPEFLHADGLSESSRVFHDYIAEMTRVMSRDEILAFINDLFRVLESTGAETVTDLTELRLREALRMVKELRKSQEMRKFIKALLDVLKEGLLF